MQEVQEIQVQSLGQEDPLEEEMATHSSIFAWEIPWTEEPGGSQSMGSQRVRYDWVNTRTAPTGNSTLWNQGGIFRKKEKMDLEQLIHMFS